jgi:hypothetical protein
MKSLPFGQPGFWDDQKIAPMVVLMDYLFD